jgi:signal transduction histidine kinase
VFRTTHIRTKLAVALAVPLAALVAVAGFEVVSARQDVSDARSQSELASASLGPGSLVVNLQNERNRAAIDLIGLGSAAELAVATNEEARSLTDPSAEDFRAETDERGGEVAAVFEPAWTALEDLESLRADIDAYDGPLDATNQVFADSVFERYTVIIEAFFDGTSQVALTVDDAALRNGAEIVDAATRQGEMRARIVRRVVQATITGQLDDPLVRQEVAALTDRGEGFDDDIRTNANGAYAGVADPTFAEPGVQSFNRQTASYLAGDGADITAMLTAVAADPNIGYTGLRTRAADLLSAEAQRVQDDALARERLFVAIALGGLVVALLVTWLASRSITRPLRSLKGQAEDMAGSRLPAAVREILDTPPGEDVVIPDVAPITVNTRDEVAEVAAALSAVQASAVELAVEQAVLRRNISDSYVNLGRRNQNLLSRQLDFITDLERNETDPDTLEGLFRLDHLATRMRRNAESLLVLAGIEPPRQWSAPVKLSDVVRAALGEVEDYQRVVVRHLEPAQVTGAVAADIAHVLAELIENALSFSPPEQSVEVRGRLTTQGYTVAVTDNGLGMAADDIERANRRLAGQESFTVAPSRYLGHYVAGHLASRLGIVVELQDSPAGGITARIDVPMALLADDELGRPVPPRADAPTAQPIEVASTPTPALEAPAPIAEEVEAPEPSTTASGLPRRGAERPDTAPVVESPAPEPVAATPVSTTPAEPVEAPAPAEPVEPAPAELIGAEASSSPEPTAEPSPAPAGAARPRGFGGLAVAQQNGASMHTLAAQGARSAAADGAPGVTGSGLTRRVPGAQRPDAAFAPRTPAPEAEAAPAAEPARSTPEDVYSFLSSFQSGVARGRADAAGPSGTDPEENGR